MPVKGFQVGNRERAAGPGAGGLEKTTPELCQATAARVHSDRDGWPTDAVTPGPGPGWPARLRALLRWHCDCGTASGPGRGSAWESPSRWLLALQPEAEPESLTRLRRSLRPGLGGHRDQASSSGLLSDSLKNDDRQGDSMMSRRRRSDSDRHGLARGPPGRSHGHRLSGAAGGGPGPGQLGASG
jgi:hypothetical protein